MGLRPKGYIKPAYHKNQICAIMSRQLNTHQHFLHLLKDSSGKQRKALVDSATNSQIDAICSCADNLLSQRIPLSPRARQRLRPYKSAIRVLADRSVSRQRKRRVLNQKGGFIGALLSTVLPTVLGGLLGAIRR